MLDIKFIRENAEKIKEEQRRAAAAHLRRLDRHDPARLPEPSHRADHGAEDDLGLLHRLDDDRSAVLSRGLSRSDADQDHERRHLAHRRHAGAHDEADLPAHETIDGPPPVCRKTCPASSPANANSPTYGASPPAPTPARTSPPSRRSWLNRA